MVCFVFVCIVCFVLFLSGALFVLYFFCCFLNCVFVLFFFGVVFVCIVF